MKPSKSNTFFTDTNILLLLGLALFVLHMLINHQYGFHQDEMVVVDNAYNLDWGYVEYPPLTPFLARISLDIFGVSLVRLTQIVAALATAIAPVALIQGSLIQYVTFDWVSKPLPMAVVE
jgi:4-amino-4-deoxy-L-arabinose transferase-like glycosyltransferase